MEESAPITRNQQDPQGSGVGKKLALVGIGLLLLIGVAGLGWYILSEPATENGSSTLSPTPFVEPTEAPTPTPMEVDKDDIRISVLNGTGIAGQAGALKTELEKLGFSEITTGNADETNATATTVTYASSVPESVQTEVTDKLKTIYQTVTAKTGSVSGSDIEIIVGLKKNQSAKATPTNKVTATPTGKATGTVTPTLTSAPTATPTTQ